PVRGLVSFSLCLGCPQARASSPHRLLLRSSSPLGSTSRKCSAAGGVLDAAQLTSMSAWSATARCLGLKGLNAKEANDDGMSAHPPQLCQRDGASAMLVPCPK